MISTVKFNELTSRVNQLVARINELEGQLKSLAATQGGEIPPEMCTITVLAAEFGISTKKAEELARNCGVMLVKHGGSYIVHETKFREAALIVIRGAKRKYGSKYWYHPLIGKFIMTKGALV